MAEVLERQRVTVRPTGAALGADIDGVDLAQPLAPAGVEAIKQAWADHLVLRFRGQHLDDDQLMRFSALFGELDLAPVIAAARVKVPGEGRYVDSAPEGHRYVSIISNIIENGIAIGALGAYEFDLAHRHVVQPGAADGQRAFRARGAAGWWRHRFRKHVSRLRHPARGSAAPS